MKSPPNRQNGIVAILDALGAASYSGPEIESFLKSREIALSLLDERIEDVARKIDRSQVEIFTLNDTVVIVLKTGDIAPNLGEILAFVSTLRKFLVDSMANNILFRGSMATGTFYIDAESNTVMGEAITDAAAWYDKAEWVGIHLTPRTSMSIQRWFELTANTRRHQLLDYSVPLKDGRVIETKAVNWPKIFVDPKLTPWKTGVKPREKLLELLSAHSVPLGTERKYSNTIAFFDEAAKEIEKTNKKLKTPPKA
jgi:hypothetical protein